MNCVAITFDMHVTRILIMLCDTGHVAAIFYNMDHVAITLLQKRWVTTLHTHITRTRRCTRMCYPRVERNNFAFFSGPSIMTNSCSPSLSPPWCSSRCSWGTVEGIARGLQFSSAIPLHLIIIYSLTAQ